MADIATAEEVHPLAEHEREALNKLLARDSAFDAPAVRRGEPYVALVNLSVPRRGDKDRQTDLVLVGETVYLTAEEARNFNRHTPRDGRQVEIVQKLTGPDGTRETPRRIPPRALSGLIFRPQATPPVGSDAPRPDPEGSSRIQYMDDAPIPERNQPQPDPAHSADMLRDSVPADAVDLPPRGGRPPRAKA